MKSTIKIAASIIALVIVLSLLGWVTAINELKVWCDRYVALSLLKTDEFQPQTITTVVRFKGKAMTAPRVVSITIKDTIKSDRPNYASMTAKQLKSLCKGTGIKGWEKLRKADLVIALNKL